MQTEETMRTTAHERINPNNLRKITKEVSEYCIRGEEEEKHRKKQSTTIPIEDVEMKTNSHIHHGDPLFHGVAFEPDGPIRVTTTTNDMIREVHERRMVQDPMVEILYGPIEIVQQHLEIIQERADEFDPSGKFGKILRIGRETTDDLLTRIALIHLLFLERIGLDEIGFSHMIVEDGVVIASNGICLQGFIALRKFVIETKNAERWYKNDGEYASDTQSEIYFGRLAMAYLTARRRFPYAYDPPTRRETT